MARLFYIHWNKEEALERVKEMRSWGHSVAYEYESGEKCCSKLKTGNYDACVIDLRRLPSHGRATGGYLAQTKATRDTPLFFIDGVAEKVAKVKAAIPSARYIGYARLRDALAGL